MNRNSAWVLASVLAMSATVQRSQAQQIDVNKNNRTIAVTATDKATVDAEVATVHIGFQVYAADSKSAYALGSKTSNAIDDALKKAGVEANAIKSDSQNVEPVEYFEIKNMQESE